MATISGKVYNDVKWAEKYPEVTIYISDSEGKILEPKVFTKTDEYGEYELSVSDDVMKNGYISLKPQFGIVDKPIIQKIDSRGKIDFDVAEASSVSEQEEVEVIAERPNWLKCKQKGGTWDSGRKVCVMPSEQKDEKPKLKTWEVVTLAGGSLLVLLLVGAIVYDMARDKK
jgi:hypothetical protein